MAGRRFKQTSPVDRPPAAGVRTFVNFCQGGVGLSFAHLGQVFQEAVPCPGRKANPEESLVPSKCVGAFHKSN